MKKSSLIFWFAYIVPVCAYGQAAPERHVWQDEKSFVAMSRTAQGITGDIKLSGNSEFATPGSKMTITFENGSSVDLTSVGASWRRWGDSKNENVTAEAFLLAKDPGILLNGNTLCGDPKSNPARYIVFHEGFLLGDTPLLAVAIFDSEEAPFDISSKGLCGTFNFYSN